MPADKCCAACNCEIDEEDFLDGQALQHGAKIYCAECAELILAPEIPIPQVDEDVQNNEEAEAELPLQPNAPKPGGTAAPAPRKILRKGKRFRGKGGPARESARGGRDAKESRGRSERGGRGKQRGGDNTMLYVIGGVVLLAGVVAFFAFSGGSEEKEEAKPKVEVDLGDKTPSGVYAQRAEEALKNNEKVKAAQLYQKAGEQAQKEGSPSQAKKYNMRYIDLEKSSTVNDLKK